jgi:hypothetical protein
MSDIAKTLGAAWKRDLQIFVPGPPDVYAMYLDEALTGFVAVIPEPKIATFNNMKCVLVGLSSWIMLKEFGAATVTPFRVVAKGKGLIEKGFMPHTGLKYPVRSVDKMPFVHIPIEDFKSV